MPALSLDSLTLTDTAAEAAILSAHAAGFELVSLWVQAPPLFPKQLLTPERERAVAGLLAGTGVGVYSLEAFDLVSPEAARAARPAIELGARLGGKAVLALNFANPDRAQAAAALAVLAEEAEACGLELLVEPVAMGRTRTLAEASGLIGEAGVDARVLFDTYHFSRVGGTPADLAEIDPALIGYVQVCDGLAGVPEGEWTRESVCERLYPGLGDFPLVELLRAAPAGVPWAVETPSVRRAAAGVSPENQAREALAALRALLARIDEAPRAS